MIVLYILAGLLLLLFLLTLVPLRVRLRFQQEFAVEIRYLFWRYELLPAQEPEEEESEPEPTPEKPSQKDKPGYADQIKRILRQKGLEGFLQALGDLLKLLGRTSKRLIYRLKLKEFDLYLCLAGAGDAAAAALLYGRVSTGVYSACGGLFQLLPCKQKGVSVDLNYDSDVNVVSFTAKLSILPFFPIKEGLILLFNSLRILKRLGLKPNVLQKRETQPKKGSGT